MTTIRTGRASSGSGVVVAVGPAVVTVASDGAVDEAPGVVVGIVVGMLVVDVLGATVRAPGRASTSMDAASSASVSTCQ